LPASPTVLRSSLHDALPIWPLCGRYEIAGQRPVLGARQDDERHLVTTPSQALHLMRPLVRCHLAELPQGLTAARAGELWQVHEGSPHARSGPSAERCRPLAVGAADAYRGNLTQLRPPGGTMRIRSTTHLPHATETVLAWHDRPGAIVRLTPPGLASADAPAEGGMREGRLVSAHLGPPMLPTALRPRWILCHSEHDPAGRFVDQQVRGPLRTWRHEHEIVAGAGGGTEIRDSIELELPRRLERLEPLAASQVHRLLAFRAEQLRDDLAFHARWAHLP